MNNDDMILVPRDAADYALNFMRGFEDDDGVQEDMKGITDTIEALEKALEGKPTA